MILRCHGCGWTAPPERPLTFRCANAERADDTDHVLTIVDTEANDRRPGAAHAASTPPDAAVDAAPGGPAEGAADADGNPFVRYRYRLYSHDVALRHGLSDDRYVELVTALDEAVAAVDGRGFRITPFGPEPALSEHLGVPVLVKDETGGVSGSHKARHLMGIMIHLLVDEAIADNGLELGLDAVGRGSGRQRDRLAIASCGNAALGAAVVARAADWPIEVFVPPWAPPTVVERLRELGAGITRCPRRDGDPPGDPCVHRFREAVAAGSVPFSCQGPDNGLTIDGGRTLGWELAEQRLHQPFGRVIIQVGGGALASSLAQGLRVDGPLPVLYPVQTEGCAPLARAWHRAVPMLELVAGASRAGGPGIAGTAEVERAAVIALAHRRSELMWPWETEPHSAANGILDDETYDWWEIIAATHESGGRPVVAHEADVEEALRLARSLTAVPVDATGSAGLAGLLRLLAEDSDIGPDGRPVAVVFTGIDRTLVR